MKIGNEGASTGGVVQNGNNRRTERPVDGGAA